MTLSIFPTIILTTETVSQGGSNILNNQIKREISRLQKHLKHISDQLAHLPEGKLIYSRNGVYYKWYHSLNAHKQYIPKANQKLAVQLGKKMYLILVQEEITSKLKILNSYQKIHSQYSEKREAFLTDHPVGRLLLPDYIGNNSNKLLEWADTSYERNPYYPENLVHKTVAGIMVRSKSEALIVRYLYENHIPFRYECVLHLGEAVYYPDFTIMHPLTGEIFYWEHFGRMDDKDYARKAFDKMENYNSYGIIPSINLITTFEDSKHPLDYKTIQNIIENYFL